MQTMKVFLSPTTYCIALAYAILMFSAEVAFGNESTEAAVNAAMVERTEAFCQDVLPSWLASESGISEPYIRSIVVDCFMGNARLAVLGIDGPISIQDLALSELPAVLLQSETGMSLDMYSPLAGRTVTVVRQEP
jgi:hypothetical protein